MFLLYHQELAGYEVFQIGTLVNSSMYVTRSSICSLKTWAIKVVEKCKKQNIKDDFWGWGEKRNGRNELGKIWMELRGVL